MGRSKNGLDMGAVSVGACRLPHRPMAVAPMPIGRGNGACKYFAKCFCTGVQDRPRTAASGGTADPILPGSAAIGCDCVEPQELVRQRRGGSNPFFRTSNQFNKLTRSLSSRAGMPDPASGAGFVRIVCELRARLLQPSERPFET